MTHKKYFIFIATFFFFLIFLIYSINFYFLSRLHVNNSSKLRFAGDINEASDRDDSSVKLKSIYKNKNPKFTQIREKLIKNFKPCETQMNFSQLWNEADKVKKLSIVIKSVLKFFFFSGPKKHQMKFTLNTTQSCVNS